MQKYFYILMGMKNSGKTTLGRILAKKLGTSFLDLDDVIEEIFHTEYNLAGGAHLTCRDIYRTKGKKFFQELEYQAAAGIRKKGVLALGGGIADNPRALSLLPETGTLIYLESAAEELFSRITRQGLPPFLEGKDPYEKFLSLYERRTKVYRKTADITVDLSGRDLNNSLEALITSLKESIKEDGHAR